MKLTTGERLNLGGILPHEGDWMTLTTVRDIQKKLLVSDKELEAIEFDRTTGNYKPANDKEKDFDLTSMESKVIKDKLVKIEGEKKLSMPLMSLYEKFAR